MASRGSIINSAKSIPGGARPTPAPQGLGGGYVGRVSPLASELDTGAGANWGATYGNFLPRPSRDFTQGAFGPFSPILPVPVDAPPEESDSGRPEPRLWQYDVGWNLPVGTPGSEGIKLADFNTLRTLADLYSVARSCIQLRKSEIRGLEWDIMPTPEAAKAMRNSHGKMKDFGARRAEAIKFFRKPDPDYFSWNSFIDALLEEILVFDALSLLIRPKWLKGHGKGLLGSDLDSLSLINGPTIRPLLDMQGAKPRPPAAAYQQYLYGVPRSDLMTIITERDIEEGGLSGSEVNAFRGDQLLYLPMVPRRWTPYGFPPIERALIPVMAGLQKQGYQLDYFREGTVPAVYVSPGGGNANMTPNQIRELQDALNAIAGDPAWKHKIIVLPADSKVEPQRPPQIADAFDEIVMTQVCMAFDVQPMELGIAPKVSTTISPGAAHQMAKMAGDLQHRSATKPLLLFLSDIFDSILQDVCGQTDMRFVFEGLEKAADEEAKTSMLINQVGSALRSIDEARAELNLQPWGLPETSDPGWSTPGYGWMPLAEAVNARLTGQLEGPVMQLRPGADESTTPTSGRITSDKPGPGTATSGVAPPPATPTGSPGRAPGKIPPNAPAAAAGSTPAHSAAAGGSKPASKSASRAVESELDALARHVRKGREITSWEPRHLDEDTLARLTLLVTAGADVMEAVNAVKSVRRVDLNGQTYTDPGPQVPMYDAAGGAGRPFPAHDVDGAPRWYPALDNRNQPGGKTDDEPPRWRQLGEPGLSREPNQAQPLTEGREGVGRRHYLKADGPNVGPSIDAGVVHDQLSENYPPEAIEWVLMAEWHGPIDVPLDDVDFDDEDSWAAHHDTDRVNHFSELIEDGDPPKPGVAVLEPGDTRVKVVDGHHRTLAYKRLGKPVRLYVGRVDRQNGPWNETHSSQVHRGNDAANKSEPPIAAGVAVRALDTGRVLMLQRAITDDDPAAGTWEFPGGKLEPGETARMGAVREWMEETGCQLPSGTATGEWFSSDGVYYCVVLTIASESMVPLADGRDQVINPDDPDGDHFEALAWWDPDHLVDCPALRPELVTDLDDILPELR